MISSKIRELVCKECLPCCDKFEKRISFMNKNTEYELFTQEVCRLIAEYQKLEALSVRQNVKLKGKSGQEHQVDVYWEYKKGGVLHKVVIVCKNYSKSVSIGKVRDFNGVLMDLDHVEGVMVTKVGYQKGAKQYADYYGIELKELRTPKAGETKIGEYGLIIEGEISHCLFLVDKEWAVAHNINIPEYRRRLDSLSFNGDNKWSNSEYIPLESEDNVLRDARGEVIISIDELKQRKPDYRQDANSCIYCFDDAFIKTLSWGLVKIKEVKFEKERISEQRTYVLDAGEFVKAIIKDVHADAHNERVYSVLDPRVKDE